MPSDITIDPFTKNYVLISSREKGLLVMTPDGDVVRSGPLPGDHRQPEGVAITKDSLLLISDEVNVQACRNHRVPLAPVINRSNESHIQRAASRANTAQRLPSRRCCWPFRTRAHARKRK